VRARLFLASRAAAVARGVELAQLRFDEGLGQEQRRLRLEIGLLAVVEACREETASTSLLSAPNQNDRPGPAASAARSALRESKYRWEPSVARSTPLPERAFHYHDRHRGSALAAVEARFLA
jgi:hypothetical protein